eukprot:scpid98018/ scgid32040/ 
MAQRDIEWWNTPLNQEMQRVDAPKLAKVGVGRYAEERLTDMTAVDVDIQVEPSAWPGVKTTPDNYILTPWKGSCFVPPCPVCGMPWMLLVQLCSSHEGLDNSNRPFASFTIITSSCNGRFQNRVGVLVLDRI